MRIGILFRETLLKELKHHPWLWSVMGVLWAFPTAVAVEHQMGGHSQVYGIHVFGGIIALILGSRAIYAESKEKALAMSLTRPISREGWLLLKVAALVTLMFGVIAVGAVVNALGVWGLSQMFEVSRLDLTSHLAAGSLIQTGVGCISSLIAGVFAQLWMEAHTGRARQVLVAMAFIITAFAVRRLAGMEGVSPSLYAGAITVLLLGGCLGFIRQLQVQG